MVNRFKCINERFFRAESGTASVEFVLILPLLALLLFGTIDIGRLMFDYHAVTKSIRDATRYLTRVPASEMGLDSASCTLNDTLAEPNRARNLALTGTVDGSGDYILGYWTELSSIEIFPTCVSNAGPTYSGFYENTSNIVSINMRASVSFPFLNGWVLGENQTMTMKISHREAHFGE